MLFCKCSTVASQEHRTLSNFVRRLGLARVGTAAGRRSDLARTRATHDPNKPIEVVSNPMVLPPPSKGSQYQQWENISGATGEGTRKGGRPRGGSGGGAGGGGSGRRANGAGGGASPANPVVQTIRLLVIYFAWTTLLYSVFRWLRSGIRAIARSLPRMPSRVPQQQQQPGAAGFSTADFSQGPQIASSLNAPDSGAGSHVTPESSLDAFLTAAAAPFVARDAASSSTTSSNGAASVPIATPSGRNLSFSDRPTSDGSAVNFVSGSNAAAATAAFPAGGLPPGVDPTYGSEPLSTGDQLLGQRERPHLFGRAHQRNGSVQHSTAASAAYLYVLMLGSVSFFVFFSSH